MSPPRIHVARLSVLLLVCAATVVAWAAPIQPFDAVVEPNPGEDVYARSGPGIVHFYPTLKLAPGDKVRVLRKDPGGWYMIDPPPGSFSWILAANVQQTGPQQGSVKANGVIVRVGAAKGTQRDVEQIRLNKGDQVEIIGEQMLDSGKGPEKWLKIKPPRGERRWVKGSFLVELNPDGTPKVIAKHSAAKVAQPADDVENSLAVAVPPTKPRTEREGPAIQRDPGSMQSDSPLYGHAPARSQSTDPFEDPSASETDQPTENDIRNDLALIDEEIKEILDRPPAAWDLKTQLEELQNLKEWSANRPVVSDVDRRLKRVIGLQRIHEDAVAMAPRSRAQTQPTNDAGMSAARQATIQTPRPDNPASSPTGGIPSQATRPAGSRFEGAGILHRLEKVPPGMPQYVIAAPDRRILCYLESDPSIDLNRYLGQSVGLNGRRYYEPRLRADRMLVQKVTPVRLTQNP